MQNEMPPLPSGWRDTIDRATSRDNRIFDDVMADIDGNNESRPSSVLGASRREQASSPSTNHGFDSYSVLEYDKEGGIALSPSPISWLQSPRRSRKRTLPSAYRPPTPPLPAHVKPGRLLHQGSTVTFPSMEYHMIYPDPPVAMDLNLLLQGAAFEKTDQFKSLPGTSFQSETTQSSSMTRQTSFFNPPIIAISDARDTWMSDTWCILPMLPAQGISISTEDQKGLRFLGISDQARRFWERLAMLGNSLRTTLIRTVPFPHCDCDLNSPV